MLRCFTYLILGVLIFGCSLENSSTRFRLVPASESGIDFVNAIEETAELNILQFHYLYNGGGVGIGDFDRDGRPDAVFSGNQGASKLYRNRGAMHFEGVSKTSGFTPTSWITGVAIVDLNADGWDDIYLSVGGVDCRGECRNLLYINDAQPDRMHFTERAAAYGLDDGFYNQQTVFFDDLLTQFGMENDALQVVQLASGAYLSDGSGGFIFEAFPTQAQEAPLHALVRFDVNADGDCELLLAGNDHTTESTHGYHDGSHGVVLRRSPSGGFQTEPTDATGFFVEGDVRRIIPHGEGELLIVKSWGKSENWVRSAEPL